MNNNNDCNILEKCMSVQMCVCASAWNHIPLNTNTIFGVPYPGAKWKKNLGHDQCNTMANN